MGLRIERGIQRPLRKGDIARSLHEACEIAIGDGSDIDQERIDCDTARGRFLRIMIIRSHTECGARNQHHVAVGHGRMATPIFIAVQAGCLLPFRLRHRH